MKFTILIKYVLKNHFVFLGNTWMKLLFNDNPYASQAMEQDNQLGKYLKGLPKESSPAGNIFVLNIFQQYFVSFCFMDKQSYFKHYYNLNYFCQLVAWPVNIIILSFPVDE